MTGRPRRRLTTILARSGIVAAALASCARGDAGTAQRTGLQALEPLFVVEGGHADSVLLHPRVLRAGGDMLYVLDIGRSAVEAFDRDGRLLWLVGRRGSGPGEFRNVSSMEVGPEGTLWLLDRANARLTGVRRDGSVHLELALDEQLLANHRLLPIDADHVGLLQMDDPVLTVVHMSTGTVVARHNHPWPEYGRHHPIAADFLPVRDAGAGIVALAFGFGLGFIVTDYAFDGAGQLHPYIEAMPLPSVRVERTGAREMSTITGPPAVRGAAGGNGLLYLLFTGSTSRAGRLLDRYDLRSARYLDSWVLPRPANGLAVLGDTVYTLELDSLPRLAAYLLPRARHDGSLSGHPYR